MHGMAAFVLPVTDGDERAAVLKLQAVDEETVGESVALRIWDGDGAVRLLAHDTDTGAMLLERLDISRHLSSVADTPRGGEDHRRTPRAPDRAHGTDGLRRLGDVASAMSAQTASAVRLLDDRGERDLLLDCAAAVREVMDEPGNQLLHWDLHYDNVLGSGARAVARNRSEATRR